MKLNKMNNKVLRMIFAVIMVLVGARLMFG